MNEEISDPFFKIKKSKKIKGINRTVYSQFENDMECFYEYNNLGELVCFRNSMGYKGFYDRRRNGFRQVSENEFNQIYTYIRGCWKEK